jgi:hypothetical protein
MRRMSDKELTGLAASVIRYADVLGERTALGKLIADRRRTEREIRRKRNRLSVLAVKLRRERRELQSYRRQMPGTAGARRKCAEAQT